MTIEELMSEYASIVEGKYDCPLPTKGGPKYFSVMEGMRQLHDFAVWSFSAKQVYNATMSSDLLALIEQVDRNIQLNLPKLSKAYARLVDGSV